MLNRFLPVIHHIARLNILFSCLLWAPAIASYHWQDNLLATWLLTSWVMLVSSCVIWRGTQQYTRELQIRDGFLLTFLLWMLLAFVASIPIYFVGINLSFTDAYFEAISGLTTTGTTIFTKVEHLQPSLNLWRHMLNWLGGMGMIVLAVAIIPTLRIGGMNILKAEMNVVNRDIKLTPRITRTAKYFWGTYIILTAIVFIALKLAGMSLFDAICHALSSISLGGFSTYSDSIKHFNSIAIEIILMISMLIGAISFISHAMVIRHKSLILYWQDEEARTFLKVVFLGIIVFTVYLWYIGFYGQDLSGLLTSLRYSAFNYISVGVACGLSATDDVSSWPVGIIIMMYVLANGLANSGSAGGGIKMIRAIILLKFIYREMLLLIHPHAVKTIKVNGNVISNTTAVNVMVFMSIYVISVFVVTLVLILTGLDVASSFSLTMACISNVGTSVGQFGSVAVSALSDLQKLVCAFTMLIGRLEIFTVLILFLPSYWKT